MNEDFDETILDNGKEFNKRFGKIKRPNWLNLIVDKSLGEAKKPFRNDKINDELNKKLLKN